jgi:type II secretory pathway pseudopilin PulG
MTIRMLTAGPFCRFLCVVLAFAMVSGHTLSAMAQTNAAQQSVRRRASGLGERGIQRREPAAAANGQGQPAARAQGADPTGRTQPALPAGQGIDTTYVSASAIAIVVLRPAQIMTAPLAELLPTEVATAAGLKYLGFDPADVEEVIAFVDPINPAAPEYGLVVKFTKPFRGSSIAPQIRQHAQLGDLGGRRYLQSQHPMLPSFYGANNQTLIVAPDATVRRLVESAGQAQSGPIVDRVKNVPGGNDLYAAVDIESIRPLIQAPLAQAAGQVPPDAQAFLQVPNLLKAAELTLNLKGSPISLVAHANDEAAAQKLEEIITEANRKSLEQMKAQLAEFAMSEDPVKRAVAQYVERVSNTMTERFAPQREGATLVYFRTDGEGSGQQQQLLSIAIIGILVALLLPAVQAARHAARRTQSSNNMKQIMLALHNYHSVKNAFPAHANYNSEGRPLLSWRVHVLPYLEQGTVYEQFKLDEPWDSPHNRALIAQMPQVYQNPNLPLEAGKTNYLAVVGEPCIMDGTQKGVGFRNVTDGTSNTIMLVEAAPDQAVEWTKPDDWEFDANNPTAGLGGVRPDGWNAGFADGSVQPIPDTMDPAQLKAMFTRAGGEAVNRGF